MKKFFDDLHAADKRISALLDSIAQNRQRGVDATYEGCLSLARQASTLEKEFSDMAMLLRLVERS